MKSRAEETGKKQRPPSQYIFPSPMTGSSQKPKNGLAMEQYGGKPLNLMVRPARLELAAF
jgi:hypothetical protein